ncbi:hypothetical protein [Pseudomonas savastanoi]|nr:hypothetical protein [Pseudomonas savastanoi]
MNHRLQQMDGDLPCVGIWHQSSGIGLFVAVYWRHCVVVAV